MAPPRMVGPGPGGRLAGPSKFRLRERHYLVGQAQLNRRVVKRCHRASELVEQSDLLRQLIGVRVVAALRHEEDLPVDAQRGSHFHDLRYLLELSSQPRLRKDSLERRAAL